jgi:hypothetical protein
MLDAAPNLPKISHGGRTYVQIAWPTAGVIDGYGGFRGFVMPEVDFKSSTVLENILQKSARRSKGLPEFYGARVHLATNMAALMAELHALDHYMVDMKPANMRFYPQAWYMAILDTDGFSINGTRRLPARHYSDEYIAPEAQGKAPSQLELQQDLFAMAVIIFRLLNNGIHPYQGVDVGPSNNPTTIQDCIFAGLYAYGRAGHSSVRPAPPSIHAFLEDQTRELFDRAFTPGQTRPTSAEWRDHLSGLIKNKTLVRCSTRPNDHAHFSKGCGLCALDRPSAKGTSSPRPPTPQTSGSVLNNLRRASAIPRQERSAWKSAIPWIALVALVASVLKFVVPNVNSPAPRPANPPNEDFRSPPEPSPQTTLGQITANHADLLLLEDATAVQQRLGNLGFFVGIPDGIWTSKSRRALYEFKSINGLGRDDAWDGPTEVRLFAQTAERKTANAMPDQSNAARCAATYYPPPTGTASNPLNRVDAVRLQGRLTDLGFYIGQKDGVWGMASRGALRDFKVSNALLSDDRWDADTERSLNAEQPVRWIDKFLGGWADDADDCRSAPIQVSSRYARSNTRVCEFKSTQREDESWRVQAVCTAEGVATPSDIRLAISDGRLTWSSEGGTRSYVKCDGG